MRPPASTTATVWAAARSRDHRFMSSAQRLPDRLDRAEVGAGAHDDLGARGRGCAAPSARAARTDADRSMRCVTSFAPTMMSTTSGRSTSSRALASCRSRSLDSAPTTARFVRRTRRPVSAATPLAMIAPDRLVRGIGPHPGGRAVAEHDDVVGLATPRPVDAVVVGGVVERRADDPAGQGRLGLDDPPAGRAERGPGSSEPAATVGRGGGDLAGPACASHAAASCPVGLHASSVSACGLEV